MTSYVQGKEQIDTIKYSGDLVLDEFNLVDISTDHVSGTVVSIINTPGSAGNVNILRIDAAGGNWTSTASACMECITEDASVTPVKLEHATNNKAFVQMKRPAGSAGYIWVGASDSLKLSTTANDAILFLPNGTGITHCGAGVPGGMGASNDNYYVPGRLEVDGIFYAESYIVLNDAASRVTIGASASLTDDGPLGFPAIGTAGWGRVQAGDDEEWGEFTWDAGGSVTIQSSSANVINSDTDGNLCVYFSGVNFVIKNRLGSTKMVGFIVETYTP